MTVRSLLDSTNYEVKTIGPKVKVETAAALLYHNKVGVLPVIDDKGRLIGIISERDVVATIGRRGDSGLCATVEQVMTREVLTMTADDTVKDAMTLMNNRRVRHLPVMDGEKLIAVLSMRDVVKQRLRDLETERNVLRDYALVR